MNLTQFAIYNEQQFLQLDVTSMDPSESHLVAKLTEILTALRADIDHTEIKHNKQLMALQEIINAKDRQIRELQDEVDSYRRPTLPAFKPTDSQTASFKKITLAKKTPKNLSQISSEPLSSSPFTPVQPALAERKQSNNTSQNSKQSTIMQTSTSVKSLKKAYKNPSSYINTTASNRKSKGKENLKIQPKKPSVPSFQSKCDRQLFSSSKPSQGSKAKSKAREKSQQSRGRSKCSREKQSINVIIPCGNFSAYSINPIRRLAPC